MADVGKISRAAMTGIADAIRAKKDTTAVLTPAQMAVEINSIVTGDDLPNAEDAYFGQIPGGEEYSFDLKTATPAYVGSQYYRVGYRFTVKETFSVLGFSVYDGGSGAKNIYLWEDPTGELIASGSSTNDTANAWNEYRLSAPVNLIAGMSYTVVFFCQFAYVINHHTSVTFNSKISYVGGMQWAYQDGVYPPNTNSVAIGAVRLIMGEPVTESTVTDYKIQKETMDNIANEIIRITGATTSKTPAEIITALQSVPVQTT